MTSSEDPWHKEDGNLPTVLVRPVRSSHLRLCAFLPNEQSQNGPSVAVHKATPTQNMDGAGVTETRLNKTGCQRDAITIQKKSIPDAPSAQISQVHFCGAFLSCQARKIQKQPVLITRKCAASTHFGNGPLNACIARRFGAPSGRRFCRCHTSITFTFTFPFVIAEETLLSQQLNGAIQCLFVSQNRRFRAGLQKS